MPKSELNKEIKRIESEIKRYKTALIKGSKIKTKSKLASSNHITTTRTKHPTYEHSTNPRLKTEKKIVKSLKNKKYAVSILIALALLAVMFGNARGFIIYTTLGAIFFVLSDHIHKKRSRFITMYTTSAVMLVILLILTNTLKFQLSLVITTIFTISLITASLLYIFHLKRGHKEEIHKSFSKTFAAVLYSHTIAFTVAILLNYTFLKIFFRTQFISTIPAIITYLLLPLFIYFLINKYLYLHFFDKKHTKKEILKGVKHGLMYATALILLIIATYLLTGIQFTIDQSNSQINTLEQVSLELQNLDAAIQEAKIVHKNINTLSSIKIVQNQRDLILTQTRNYVLPEITIKDYFTDDFLKKIANTNLEIKEIESKAKDLTETTQDIIREYQRIKIFGTTGLYDDGTTNLEEHNEQLNTYLSQNYRVFSPPNDVSKVIKRMEIWSDSYTGLLGDGYVIDFLRIYSPEINNIMTTNSKFEDAVIVGALHTKIIKELILFKTKIIILDAENILSSQTIDLLYNSPDLNETIESMIVRKRVIKSNNEAVLALAEG